MQQQITASTGGTRICYRSDKNWALTVPLETNFFQYRLEELERLAIAKYEERTGTIKHSYPSNIVDKMAVNYIKHELCAYDRILNDMRDKTDTWTYNKYLVLRLRLLKEIAHAFPELGKECIRQWRKETNGMTWFITPEKLLTKLDARSIKCI